MPLAKKTAQRLGGAVAAFGAAVALSLSGATAASAQDQIIPLSYSTPNYHCNATWWSSSVHLWFQCDGNLVLYRNSDNQALWATGTYGPYYVPDTLDFSHTGDVEMYSAGLNVCHFGYPLSPNGWAAVQDDGNFVIYNSSGSPVWASDTYKLVQGDVDYCRKG